MRQAVKHKEKDYNGDFAKLYDEADEIAKDVNHIVRVNGSSAFPMPKTKKTCGFLGRFFRPNCQET